jgi:hypothetical protein
MELKEKLRGCLLLSINKTGTNVKIKFFNPATNKNLVLSFDGLVFETPSLVLNREVIRTEYSHILGYKSMTQLQHQNKNPSEYKQLLIELNGSTADYKNELLCAFKDYQLRQTPSTILF